MTVLETDKRGGRPKANMPKPQRRPMNPRARRQLLGAIGLLAVIAIIGGVILSYEQVFTPGVTATVLSPRAGLLMEKGADVTLDGVTVGQVTSIDPVGDDEARLGIKIQPSQQQFVPANVTASIDAPSVFGPKFVNLTAPKQAAAAQTIQAGQVINQVQVSPEIDTVFSNLVGVLNSVHPAKVASTLGAISTALNGQGANLGNFIGQFNSYLQQFNPSLPALGNDLAVAPSVANAWSVATPDALKTLDNLRVTSGTLTAQQAQFDAFLVNLSGFAGNSQSFLSNNETGLTKTLSTLLPTTQLLSNYSPEFSCLSASAEEINKITTSNSLTLNTALIPGAKEYSNPSNLPTIGAKSPANCYGGPLNKQTAASWNGINFNDGSGSAGASSSSGSPGLNLSSLAPALFGSNAGAASSAAKKGH